MTNKPANTQPLLELRGVSKSFGPVKALQDVDLKINKKEVVALLGDNGAGKSTLIKIISGLYTPTEGEIFFEGKKVEMNSPQDARTLGVETVYQDLALVETMSIMRNFFLGSEPVKRFGPFRFLDRKKMIDATQNVLADIGLKNLRAKPMDSVSTLSGGERQAIAIGRTMYFGAKLVILDEPTSALSLNETNKVLSYIEQAKESGLAVIFITHNMYHAYPVSDRIVIIEHGRKVEDCRKDEKSLDDIANIIMKGAEAVKGESKSGKTN